MQKTLIVNDRIMCYGCKNTQKKLEHFIVIGKFRAAFQFMLYLFEPNVNTELTGELVNLLWTDIVLKWICFSHKTQSTVLKMMSQFCHCGI